MPRSISNERAHARIGGGLHDVSRRFAQATSHVAGSAWAFIAAVTAVVVWGAVGPMFG